MLLFETLFPRLALIGQSADRSALFLSAHKPLFAPRTSPSMSGSLCTALLSIAVLTADLLDPIA
ncbi:MAG: hypothetical protein CVU57_25565 [Deltaproteobacteria bacterium HGW-Deltaproteobacteria-15]|nr:MAG: hypothetical protein CVU57_25565 [Deltaproteobacteria bacterium HGW-Deltaproteobacteria-15]